ncbi:NUP159 [[Candida] subhashii]|uniref:NUP159 n=1 Tax=[Candida] subhashii TaxID=561895 RepID=A0A8J5Q6W4_9ASCO|nr:NUP159 [[Candida] subhashii]KAG7661236.1 NUP159 [[Candida] subhashii]
MSSLEEIISEDLGFKLDTSSHGFDLFDSPIDLETYGNQDLKLLAINDDDQLIATSNIKSLKIISSGELDNVTTFDQEFEITQIHFNSDNSKLYILNSNIIQSLSLADYKNGAYEFNSLNVLDSSISGILPSPFSTDKLLALTIDNQLYLIDNTKSELIASNVSAYCWDNTGNYIHATKGEATTLNSKKIEFEEDPIDSQIVSLFSLNKFIVAVYDKCDAELDDHDVRSYIFEEKADYYLAMNADFAPAFGSVARSLTYYSSNISDWIESQTFDFVTSSLAIEISTLSTTTNSHIPEIMGQSEDIYRAQFPIDEDSGDDCSPVGMALSINELNSEVLEPCQGVDKSVGKLPKVYCLLHTGKLITWWVFHKHSLLNAEVSLERAIEFKKKSSSTGVAPAEAKEDKIENPFESAADAWEKAKEPYSPVSTSIEPSSAFGKQPSTAFGAQTIEKPSDQDQKGNTRPSLGDSGFVKKEASPFGSTGFGSTGFAQSQAQKAAGFGGSTGFGAAGFGSVGFGGGASSFGNQSSLAGKSSFGSFANQASGFGNVKGSSIFGANENKGASPFAGIAENKTIFRTSKPVSDASPFANLTGGTKPEKPIESPFARLGKSTSENKGPSAITTLKTPIPTESPFAAFKQAAAEGERATPVSGSESMEDEEEDEVSDDDEFDEQSYEDLGKEEEFDDILGSMSINEAPAVTSKSPIINANVPEVSKAKVEPKAETPISAKETQVTPEAESEGPIAPAEFLVFDGLTTNAQTSQDSIMNEMNKLVQVTEANLKVLGENSKSLGEFITEHEKDSIIEDLKDVEYWRMSHISKLSSILQETHKPLAKLNEDLKAQESMLNDLSITVQKRLHQKAKLDKLYSHLALLQDELTNQSQLKHRPLDIQSDIMRTKLREKITNIKKLEAELLSKMMPIKAKDSFTSETIQNVERVIFRLNYEITEHGKQEEDLAKEMEKLQLETSRRVSLPMLSNSSSSSKLRLRQKLLKSPPRIYNTNDDN